MNLFTTLNVAIVVTVVACLAWPATTQVHNMNRYGKQQLAQKQYRYGNPTWANGINRAGGWASSSYGNMMRHYPVSMARYGAIMGGGRQTLSPDDYYDGEVRSVAYDPSPRRYDRLDYAVVRYPSYGVGYGGYGGYGYYPVASLAAPGGGSGVAVDDDLLYDDDDDDRDRDRDDDDSDDSLFGDRTGQMAAATINRYESATSRYPMTDKIHNFRKVFMSNLVSPSNAFKSPKERQLYDFWESLINGDLDDMQQTDDTIGQQRLDRQQLQSPLDYASPSSLLYQHLPPIFLKLQQQQQQKQKLQNQQHLLKQHYKSVDEQTPPPPPSPPSSSYSALSSPLQTVQRGNFYKQWANGSPLIKRSSVGGVQRAVSPLSSLTSSSLSSSTLDNDDVRQLQELKSNDSAINTTATATTMTTSTTTTTTMVAGTSTAGAPSLPMADGGQREFVLPRPAGEKTDLESLLEVIAEGGLRGNYGDNGNFPQDAKVNKKRSFVSDETSLAAQLGALRKN
ncbi:uncharacterized protein LOC132930012 [Rhopalosiphum padi]|uniref:uncharacterized protein LOC132930012 n=1 Tax=Rhopalosiphum padi TaxID=40932 RepID=UPI00298E42A0|nr:uncharacterized protein LOC132930012 [Rhopalosiphum padi]